MHGDGTKPVITQNSPPARLLDLSRLVSRVGRGPLTGVDRVEMAYLHKLLQETPPLFSLIRISGVFALLDEERTRSLLARMTGKSPWGRRDPKSMFRLKQSKWQQRVQSDCRRLAIANSKNVQVLLDRLPKGFSYLNVGHSNLSEDVMKSVKSRGGQVAVLVHDMIPLEYPELQRAGTVDAFEKKMVNVSKYADVVIYNSAQSQSSGAHHLSKMGGEPNSIVAHLGITKPVPSSEPLPREIDPNTAFFVTVGTIEPRKNHALLLDIWQEFEQIPNAPQLVIIGSRGWNNEAVFDRLNSKPVNVVEIENLSDRRVAQLVTESAGLLFPSITEGFGLPPAEAILLQTPVICGDLPVYREFLGDIPIYADTADRYLWKEAIQELVHRKEIKKAVQSDLTKMPTWRAHFDKVLEIA